MDKPAVTVMHSLSGRVRLRLSRPPKNFADMERSAKGHEGIHSFSYTPVTGSALIRYDPGVVREQEIIIRLALSLSRDYQLTPVRLLSRPVEREMSGLAALSGLLLLVTLVQRVASKNLQLRGTLGWVSAIGVAAAVVEHAWSEVQKRGSFDPEALSIVYLISSLPRGNFLPAALFTWVTTFGRHLVRPPAEGLELSAVELKGSEKSGNGESFPPYEVVVAPDKTPPDRMALLRTLPSVLFNAIMGCRAGKGGVEAEKGGGLRRRVS